VHVRETEKALRIDISDTGAGFHEADKPGFGLSNVRGRIKSLYGDEGRLLLEENRPYGLRAVVEVPRDEN
jgi:LytS/YehU family sensor histidine kinase